MAKKGRLTQDATARRDRLEAALWALSGSLSEIDEVVLRSRQAMRRTALVADVLGPAIERLGRLRERVRAAQRRIGEAWCEEQERKWEEESEAGND